MTTKTPYRKIEQIDGHHPFKEAVPGGFVDYQVRRRKGGRVRFFNFPLAKQMGLIAADHPHDLNPELSAQLLETFSLLIINEYDLSNEVQIRPEDIKPNTYMATRYLQLQHPDRKGLTSGDGRSIWNGVAKAKGLTWDISSCGTGATRLSPATAINKTFYQSGDPRVSYGCGYSTLSEGIIDVLFSEILNRNRVATERILCIIEYPGEYAVTVRAGLNLLRPSHFFNHLKQGAWQDLKNVTDYYCDRQQKNKVWDIKKQNKYDYFLKRMTETFAAISANFEAQYIFCWLDWDGDNILADGAIIDFGSVRQFGLYYHEYRFDDDARWSTSIKEQKQKARYTVQTFAQMIDFIKSGRKKPIDHFRKHAALKRFDRLYEQRKRDLLLWRLGFHEDERRFLQKTHRRKIIRFEKIFYALEQRKSKSGPERVPDGINWRVLFSMRRLISELLRHYKKDSTYLPTESVLDIMVCSGVDSHDIEITPYLRRQLTQFQTLFQDLIRAVARKKRSSFEAILKAIAPRAEQINCEQRITGDSVCLIGEKFVELRTRADSRKFHALLEKFVEQQILDPDYVPSKHEFQLSKQEQWNDFLDELKQLIHVYREGI